jgi:hypothetical protein
MTELDKALSDIAAMRTQMARALVFRGYGPAALSVTAGLAGVAGLLQPTFVANPTAEPTAYISLWAAVAVLSATVISFEAIRRTRKAHAGLADDMLLTAVEQFLPAGLAGVLLSLVIQRYAPENLWMLPGLWQVLLSLGVFAACASLTRSMMLVAIWYLCTGLACLALARGTLAFTPLAMAGPFVVGQLLAAFLLYQHYRTSHVED